MRPWTVLAVIAALAGLLWRAEVEHRGWAGLTWASYFHLAVPVAVALFLAWVAYWIDAASRARRVAVVLSLAVYAAVAVPATELSLRYAYSRWAFLSPGSVPFFWWWLLAPTSVAGLLVLCRTPPGWRRWLASQCLFLAALPFACALIEVLPQHGHADLIHTIKSGLLAPWLVLALGVGVPVRASEIPPSLRGR